MTIDPSTLPDGSAAGLQVRTRYWPLTFLLALVRPRIELDGAPPIAGPWGDSSWWVAPGQHTVRCSFRWVFISRAGDAWVTVAVPAGHVVHLVYEAPHWFVFIPGKWTVGPPVPILPGPAVTASAPSPEWQPVTPVPSVPSSVPTTPADWFADPSGRHEHRYWDGTRWTEHVADAGVSAVDPPPS